VLPAPAPAQTRARAGALSSLERGSCLDELIDSVEPLVICREHQGRDPALPGESGRWLAVDVSGAGGHQDVGDLGHPEHRRAL
jgi:hypothetical protein